MKTFDIFDYEPFEFQEKIHKSNAKIRVIAAAARIGKTYLATAEAKARMLYLIPQVIWCVAPTYKLAEKVFRGIWEYIHSKEGRKLFPTQVAQRKDMLIILHNGTRIEGKSTDNPDSLLGEGVDLMIVDEASRVPDDIFTQYLVTRLITNDGDLLLISTPRGINTMFHKYYLQGQDPDVEDIESWSGTIYDNPLISEKAIKFTESQEFLDPIGYKQEVLGQFVSHEGDVFPTFDRDTFFVDVPYRKDLPVTAAIDHGVRNPFACLFMQKVGKQVRIFKEYYVIGKGDIEHAEYLKPIFKKLGIKKCVVDPREPNTMITFRKIIPFCSFVPGPAKEIELGINIIRDHLTVDPATKKPLLVMDKTNCKKLLWEFQQAHYPKGEKEIPVDKDNHALSALRYYVLKYCNFLNRTDLSFFMSQIKVETVFTSTDKPSVHELYSRDLWMDGFNN